MSYLVLARKWRPQTFEEMVAQEHVTRTLMNAISHDKVAHAYLFAGPRGIGKTTAARILAKALNCHEGISPTPCNHCPSCVQITESRSPDVFEIDGASNRGIDEVRSLRERIQYAPQDRYKIFIIDEVHMLTKDAFNALLKTIEEPPPYIIFIFATTEPEKVIGTILSRCQRFDFRRIPVSMIKQRLAGIATQEGIKLTEEGALMLANRADGSMRDALSLFDQILAYASDQEINPDLIARLMGMLSFDAFCQLAQFILDHKPAELLSVFDQLLEQGTSLQEICSGLIEHYHNLLLTRFDSLSNQYPQSMMQKYKGMAQKFQVEDLLRILKILSGLQRDLKFSANPRYKFEEDLVYMASLESMFSIQQLIKMVSSGRSVEIAGKDSSHLSTPGGDEPPMDDNDFRELVYDPVPNYVEEGEYHPRDEKWQKFMQQVQHEKGDGFTAPINKAKVIYDENRIIIEFPEAFEIQMQFLAMKNNYHYLASLVKEIYSDNTELEFLLKPVDRPLKDYEEQLPGKVMELFKKFEAKPED
ncbi:DNA polymerase III subunit gamma/tau [bacterium]|nr:DNA polymerase III subunit gamma/tau [bacterium]